MENLTNITCGICHEDHVTDIGEIDSCFHRFCHPCINQWAAIESKCPFCKVRFTRVTHKQLASPTKLARTDLIGVLPGNVISVEVIPERNQRVVFEDPNFIEWINTVGCVVCGSPENEDQLLLCDGCDQACHTYCVGLTEVPEGDWFCSACTASRARQARRQLRGGPAAAAGTRRSPSPIAARSRRQRVELLEDTESEEEEEEETRARRPAQRQRHAPAPARSHASRQRNVALADALDGFVVSDSEEIEDEEIEEDEVSDLEDESPAIAAAGNNRQRRGSRGGSNITRRRQTAAAAVGEGPATAGRWRTTQQRQRHAPSPNLYSEEEEEEWKSSDSDDNVTEMATIRNHRENNREVRRARVSGNNGNTRQRQGNTRRQRTTTTTTTTTTVAREVPAPPRRRIPGRDNDREVGAGQTAAQRRVAAISHSWGALRSGISTFGDVVSGLPAASTAAQQHPQQQQPARRRLQTARQLEEAQLRTNRAPVIDLTSSQSPSPAPQRRQQQPARNEEEERGQILSPPLLSLSSRIRAELAQCQERGAQLLPRNNRPRSITRRPASSTTPVPNRGTAHENGGGGPSSSGRRMRTVGDFAAGAAMARNTPGSGGGGSGGIQQRNSSDWRGTGAGAAPHQLPWQHGSINRQQQQQQQQQGGPRSGDVPPAPSALLQSFAYTNVRGSQEREIHQNRDRNHANSDGRSSPRPLHERLQQRSAATATMAPPLAAFQPPRQLPPVPTVLPEHGTGSQTPLGLQRPRHLRAVIDADIGAEHSRPSVPADKISNIYGGPSTARTLPTAIPSSPGGFDIPSPRRTTTNAGCFRPNPKFLSKDLVKTQLRLMFSPGDLTVDQLKEVTKKASQAVYRDHGAEATGDHAAMAVDEALKDVLGKGKR